MNEGELKNRRLLDVFSTDELWDELVERGGAARVGWVDHIAGALHSGDSPYLSRDYEVYRRTDKEPTQSD